MLVLRPMNSHNLAARPKDLHNKPHLPVGTTEFWHVVVVYSLLYNGNSKTLADGKNQLWTTETPWSEHQHKTDTAVFNFFSIETYPTLVALLSIQNKICVYWRLALSQGTYLKLPRTSSSHQLDSHSDPVLLGLHKLQARTRHHYCCHHCYI